MKAKRIVSLIAAGFAAVGFAAYAQTVPAADRKTVPSKINDATVFLRGAELTHSASATLKRGENEVYIEGLSPSVDINSIRVKASGRVVVASYEFTVDYLSSVQPDSPRVKELEALIAKKQEERQKTDIDIKIQENMRTFLSEGTTKNVSGSESGMGIDDLKKTMEYYKSQSTQIESELMALRKKAADLTSEISKLNAQYNQERADNSKTSGVLKLTLSSPADQRAEFAVTYYTPAATWEPYYDVNIESTSRPLAITYKSRVSQTTGIDWTNVRLTLSTSAPSSGKEAPLFSTWFLEPRQEIMVRGLNKEMMMQNAVSYDRAELEEVVVTGIYGSSAEAPVAAAEGMADYVAVSDNAINMTYEISMPYTIPGNGKSQNIDLLTKEVAAEYKYYTAPKLDAETYVVAEIPEWQKLDLLTGAANVTYDGTNIGQTLIDASSTKEKLSITLGTDSRVTVKREKLQDFSSTRTFGSTTEQIFTYRITVKNNQKTAIRMVTKDQYPLSTQKNIEVALREKQTTKWTANIPEVGVVTWEEEIPAGETRVYELSYSVKYPKDMKLNL